MVAFLIILFALIVIFSLVLIISMWKIYSKAGKPGWACLIPIYNYIIWLEIVKKPSWWIILMLIPIVNIVVLLMLTHQLSLAFGKDIGYTLGIIFLPFIFIPILGFGSAKYVYANVVDSGVTGTIIDADLTNKQ